MAFAIKRPKQARSIETFEKLLRAAQEILSEKGIEGLNSNAVADRAGLPPTAFYRYFENKHAVLFELGERLMQAQNLVLEEVVGPDVRTPEDLEKATCSLLKKTLEVTRAFTGGFALLTCLRAIPELRPVRLKSHDAMATVMAEEWATRTDNKEADDLLFTQARTIIEMGYSVIEMLFETDFRNEDLVITTATRAILSVSNEYL